MKARFFQIITILFLALAIPSQTVATTVREKPKFVLQITIDQMRGDLSHAL